METYDDRSFTRKVKDTVSKGKQKVQEVTENVTRGIKEHPMESFTIACLVLPGVLKIGNSLIRADIQKKETRYNECDIYDPRTGTHYYTRKPLTNKQKLNLEAEYKEGRNKGEILRRMGLI